MGEISGKILAANEMAKFLKYSKFVKNYVAKVGRNLVTKLKKNEALQVLMGEDSMERMGVGWEGS